ncbi:DNA glycosylase [Lactifluus subvellereus]|nr:DNA glycosylase [Lactifluus subvellereus]
MPVTRSATRIRAARISPVVNTNHTPKREASASDSVVTKRTKAPRTAKVKVKAEAEAEGGPRPLIPPSGEEIAPLPVKLTFSLEDAKDHLVRADHRFRDVFSRLPCKPFERLEGIHPFRTLCTSIIGQQISWLAARAIQHKFLRLYFPELPESPDGDYWAKTRQEVFPSAYQVANTDLATLRTAGLSGRKAEYVRDLATRFADGRLTNQKLLDASDEELFELLTAVYGIGKWTVEMFAIFSLRRPDILPVGDLGVQRGLLRWILSLHQPEYCIEISPKKLPDPTADRQKAEDKSKPKSKPTKPAGKRAKAVSASAATDSDQEAEPEADELPSSLNGRAGTTTSGRLERAPTPPPPDASSVLPAVATTSSDVLGTPRRRDTNVVAAGPTPGALGFPSMPPPLTPSVTQVLSRAPDAPPPPPLPAGLTVASLGSRLGGKKRIKGAILTPSEMEALTESWRPYRSIGVYFMWALVDQKAGS